MTREASVRRAVVALLNAYGDQVCYRSNPPSPFDGQAGDPDIIACAWGQTVIMELKRPDWVQTPAWERSPQGRRVARWLAAGAIGGIVRSRADAMVIIEQARRGAD